MMDATRFRRALVTLTLVHIPGTTAHTDRPMSSRPRPRRRINPPRRSPRRARARRIPRPSPVRAAAVAALVLLLALLPPTRAVAGAVWGTMRDAIAATRAAEARERTVAA